MTPLSFTARLMLITCTVVTAHAQGVVQLGPADRLFQTAATAGAERGAEMALAGDDLFVGAPGQGTWGAVYWMKYVDGAWQQQQLLLGPPRAAGSRMGAAIGFDGESLLIGSPFSSAGGGSVDVWVLQNNLWVRTNSVGLQGVGANARAGFSIDLDGEWAVVGAPGRTVSGMANAGSVHALRKVNGVWSHFATLGTGYTDSELGYSCAISGTRIVAGWPGAWGGSAGTGAIRAWRFDGTAWVEGSPGYVSGMNPQPGERVGEFVEISADRIVSSGGLGARVHSLQNGNWGLGSILSPYLGPVERFGDGFGLSGAGLVVGAPGTAGSAASAALLYERHPVNWAMPATRFELATAAALLGRSSAIHSSGILIGAPGDEGDGNVYLGVPLSDLDDDGVPNSIDNCPVTANPDQADLDSDAIGDACDTDLDNDGRPNQSDNCPRVANPNQANSDGDAYGNACDNCPHFASDDLTDSDGDGAGDPCDRCPSGPETDSDSDGIPDACDCRPSDSDWGTPQVLQVADGLLSSVSGQILAVSGDWLAVGDPEDDAAGQDAGAVQLFQRNLDGVWQTRSRLIASDAAPGAKFGASVAISGNRMLIGAPGAAAFAFSSAGAAYLFEYDGSTWNESTLLTSESPQVDGAFGTAVAMASGTLVISAPDEEEPGVQNGGTIYFYGQVEGVWVVRRAESSLSSQQAGARRGLSLAGDGAIVIASQNDTTPVFRNCPGLEGNPNCPPGPCEPLNAGAAGRVLAYFGVDGGLFTGQTELSASLGNCTYNYPSPCGSDWLGGGSVSSVPRGALAVRGGYSAWSAMSRVGYGCSPRFFSCAGSRSGRAFVVPHLAMYNFGVFSSTLFGIAGAVSQLPCRPTEGLPYSDDEFDAGVAVQEDGDRFATTTVDLGTRREIRLFRSSSVFSEQAYIVLASASGTSLGQVLAVDGDWLAVTDTSVPGGAVRMYSRCAASASQPGDMNCDGVVTVGDIGPFVLALTDPAGYAAQFPGCDSARADINGDGAVSVGDIGPFVALITN